MPNDRNYLNESSSQTAGPYVHIGLLPSKAGFQGFDNEFSNDLTAPGLENEVITLQGGILDGEDKPVLDGLIEIWQADAEGQYADEYNAEKFRGWGRAAADFDSGLYTFRTIKPGAVRFSENAYMAPHISCWVVARGINLGLHTRLYFPEDIQMHQNDPVLSLIKETGRRDTLIANKISQDGADAVYNFDIRLQGENETVFFDV